MYAKLADVSSRDVLSFGLLILFSFFALFGFFILTYFWKKERACLSPYSGKPMRKGSDIPLHSVEVIMRYLYYFEGSYENRIFMMRDALVCRETGRIFPRSVSWLFGPRIDWTFLQKQHPGNWISWGSLTTLQQQEIRDHHDSLEGFQTEFSSRNPSPRAIEKEFAMAKPGPLYVDLNNYWLMGWKEVPETDFEVLVVQKPRKLFTLSFDDKKKKGHR